MIGVKYSSVKTTVYTKGELTERGVVSSLESSAYPENGYQDKYWYVKIDK